jgi:acyl-coenzyme A synthetase/AMP-(fatty) acid ligase
MPQDRRIFLAIIATLKAGRIVLVLNGGDPPSRVRELLDDAEPTLILTVDSHRERVQELAGSKMGVISVDALPPGSAENPKIEIGTDDIAFLVYTSGSTGRPKGVMKTHGCILRDALDVARAASIVPEDRILLLASLWGNQALCTTWCALVNGATLMSFPVVENGVTGLAEWLIKQRVSFFISASSLFRHFMKSIDTGTRFPDIRVVKLSADPATREDFEEVLAHFPKAIVMHAVGGTETDHLAHMTLTRDAAIGEGRLPVGRPFDGVDLRILDEEGLDCPSGTIGTLSASSRYLAAGYWRDPEMTAKYFFEGPNGTRVYRGGDLAYVDDDGLIVLVGRKDATYKIRGQRVDVAEVERGLSKISGVEDVAVVAERRLNGELCLVAYVVSSRPDLTSRRLRTAGRAVMEGHLVPSFFVFVEALPRSANGKVDRTQLRNHARPLLRESTSSVAAADTEAFTAQSLRPQNSSNLKMDRPQTETEILLADVWAESLERPDIGRNDDFFNLGGDSLSGAVVAARVYATLGVMLNLGELADHSTLASLAAFIDERQRVGTPKTATVVPVPRASTMPMSLVQQAIWNHWRQRQGRAGLTHVTSHRVTGPVDIEILKLCLSFLIDRYAILRTTFGVVDGGPVQIIHPSAPLGFSFIDLAGANNPEGEAEKVIREEASLEIDLEKLPIKRDVLIRIADKTYRLIRISHPLITDGLAFQILDSELASLYEAMLHGREPPFPKEPPLQYADYAVWQRQIMRPDGPYFNAAVNWWKKNISSAPKANPLPFRRLIRRAPLDPSEGVLQWRLEEGAAKRLDEIARGAGATHFVVRLAAFAVLIADVTGSSTIVIGTGFANRNHVETQNIVGRFVNTVHLIFPYDANKTFLEWLEFVRNQVFEASTRSELPYDTLRASGVEPPEIEFYFTMSSDQSDQHFGNLTISSEFCGVGTMPWKLMFDIDEQKPENCRVNFDANLYDRKEMRVMLDRYLRLLQVAAREPELPISKLLAKTGAKPLRWTCANYAAPFYEFITSFYASSPILKMCWRPIRRWVLSGS